MGYQVQFETGHVVEFDSEPTPEIIAKVAAEIGIAKADQTSGKGKKTSWQEDVAIGIGNTAHQVKNVWDLAAAKAASTFGADADAEAIYADREERLKRRDIESAGREQGFGGEVISGVAGMVPAIAAIPFMGPMAAMGGMAGLQAIDNTAEDIRTGESYSVPGMVAKTMADAGINTVANMLPAGKGVIGGAKWGVVGNLAGQAGTDIVGQIATDSEAAAQRYALDPRKYAVSGVTGGITGGLIGAVTRGPDDQAATPTTKPPMSESDMINTTRTNLTNTLSFEEGNVRKIQSTIDSIHGQAADRGYSDKQLEYLQVLEGQMEQSLTKVQQIRQQLAALTPSAEETVTKQPPRQAAPDEQVPVEAYAAGPRANPDPVGQRNVVDLPYNIDHIGPHEPHKTGVSLTKQVESGKKPAAILHRGTDPDYQYALDNLYTIDLGDGMLIAAKDIDSAKRLKDAFDSKDSSRIGKALGYTDAEITSFNNRSKLLDSGEWVKDTSGPGVWVRLGKNGVLEKYVGEVPPKVGSGDTAPVKPSKFELDLDQMAKAAEEMAARKPSNPARSFPGDPETRVDPNLVAAIDSGGFYGGLKHVVDTMTDTPLGEVASRILANKLVDPDIQLKTGDRSIHAELGTFEGGAQTRPNQGTVSLWDKGKNPITFVHEAVHAASASVIAKWRANDPSIGLPARQAVKGLDRLYKYVQGQKLEAKFVNAMQNLDEFLAYGLTDHAFQQKLSSIKYEGSNVLSQFAAKIAQMLGFDTKGKSALDELLHQGGIVIDHAGPSGFKVDKNGKVLAMKLAEEGQRGLSQKLTDTVAKLPPEQVLQVMIEKGIKDIKDSRFVRFLQKGVGDQQFMDYLRTEAPYAYNIAKWVNQFSVDSVKMENDLLNNTSGGDPRLKKVGMFNLDHQHSPDSVKALWTKKVKVADAAAVQEVMKKGFDNPVDPVPLNDQNRFANARAQYERNLERHGQHLTDHQKAMYRAAAEMFVKGAEAGRIRELRAGWYPATRRGDHAVTLDFNGVAVHLETFRDKAQADMFIAKAKEQFPNLKANYADKSGDQSLRESYTTIRDLLRDSANRALTPEESRRMDDARRVLDDIAESMAMHAKFGKHEEHRTGLTGAMGSKLFQSAEMNAQDFIRSVVGMPHEFAVLHKKRSITQLLQKHVLSEQLQQNYPVQADLVARMIENAVNDKPMNAASKFGQAVHEWANSAQAKFIANDLNPWIKKSVDRMNKVFGTNVNAYEFQLPDINVLDRITGVGAQPFYAAALTSRPAFWAAQLMTSPFALRQVLVETAMNRQITPINWKPKTIGQIAGNVKDVTINMAQIFADTTVAVAKGMVSAAGKQQPWFKKAMSELIQDTYSIQPQFHNEINDPMRNMFGEKHDTAQTMYEYGTGSKMSAWADSVSRYHVASVALHLFYDMGYRGKDLTQAAAKFTDTTMVQYGKQHTPPILNELGSVGQLIAPLMKYPIAQTANLINDLRFAKNNINKNALVALAPAMSTILTSAVMGGAFGTAVAVEYETLRTILKAAFGIGMWAAGDNRDQLAEEMFGETEFDEIFPPLTKLIFDGKDIVGSTLKSAYNTVLPEEFKQKYPDFAGDASKYGVPSALTGPVMTEIGEALGIDLSGRGVDIGSGLRFQTTVAGVLEKGEVSVMDAMPIVSWWADTLFERLPLYVGGTEAERYKAIRNMAPIVGGRLAVDEVVAGPRGYVPAVGKDHVEENKEPYNNQARVAAGLGASTLTSKEQQYQFERIKQEKKIEEVITKRIQKALDRGDGFNIGPMIREGAKIGMTPDTIFEKILTAMKTRELDKDFRFKVGTDLSISTREMMRIVEDAKRRQQQGEE